MEMFSIIRNVTKKDSNPKDYLTTDIFDGLISIINKDNTKLEGPTEKQVEIRKQIIENKIAEIEANQNGKNVVFPNQISQQDLQDAVKLSPLEMSERNKEYAIDTLAILSKKYIDEIEKKDGSVVPLTDVPGISNIVNMLKSDSNAPVKLAVLKGLYYIQRPEYKEELSSVFKLATQDNDKYVAECASIMFNKINENRNA